MATHSVEPSGPAPQVTVHADDGSAMPGFVVRTDTVLLIKPPLLHLPLHVDLGDGHRHSVVGLHVSEPSVTTTAACALLLPASTVTVVDDLFPPSDQMPTISEDPADGTRSVWCRLFPRIPGCS